MVSIIQKMSDNHSDAAYKDQIQMNVEYNFTQYANPNQAHR